MAPNNGTADAGTKRRRWRRTGGSAPQRQVNPHVHWVNLIREGERLDGILRDMEVRDRQDPAGNLMRRHKGEMILQPRKVLQLEVEIPPDGRDGPGDEGLRVWN